MISLSLISMELNEIQKWDSMSNMLHRFKSFNSSKFANHSQSKQLENRTKSSGAVGVCTKTNCCNFDRVFCYKNNMRISMVHWAHL